MANIEVHGVEAIVIDLEQFPARVLKATVRAINRAIASGRSLMVKEMSADTGLKQKDVREAIVLKQASASNPVGSIAASMKRIPLIKFNAKGPRPSRGRGRGVTYRLPGGKGRLEHAFFAVMSSGHEGIFERTPGKYMKGTRDNFVVATTRGRKGRQAIHEKYGPSLGQVFKKFRPAGLAQAQAVFEKNFDHELEFASSPGQVDAD